MARLLRSIDISKITCPRQHMMKRFSVTPVMFVTCDSCKREMPTGASMHGCRKCNMDYCSVHAIANSPLRAVDTAFVS